MITPSRPRGAATATLCRLDGVVKRYRDKTVLDGVGFAVGAGEVVALLGRNGAGKTTSVDILLGLRRADAGRVELVGGDPRTLAVRRRVGAAPQEPDFPSQLTPREVLGLVAAHYDRPEQVDVVLDRFGLAAMRRKRCGSLSGGQKRRLATACAVVGDPELAVLDEPSAALDVEGRQALWSAVRTVAEGGRGVLLTTHDMEEAEELADRVVVIHGGRTVADGDAAALRSASGVCRLIVRGRFDATPEAALPGVVDARISESAYHLLTTDPVVTRRALVNAGVAPGAVETAPPSLREAFLALTTEETS